MGGIHAPGGETRSLALPSSLRVLAIIVGMQKVDPSGEHHAEELEAITRVAAAFIILVGILDATSQGSFQVEVVGGSLRQLVPQEVDGVARGRLDGLLQQLVQAPGEAIVFWALPHSVQDGKGRAGPSQDVDDLFVSVEHGAIIFQIESERPDLKSDHRSGAKSLRQRALKVPRVHSALKVRD
ncbi:hypothetical protein PG995_004990 [Apiospora arundinis]